MKERMLMLVFALGQLSCYSQNTGAEQDVSWNVPAWVNSSFKENELGKDYEFAHFVNPFLLKGEFNGDDSPDICILIKEKLSEIRVIAIFHGGSKDYHILGAGQSFDNGGDDFTWLGVWMVKPKALENQKGEGIYLSKPESASGLVYWNGQRYLWSQVGD